MMPPTALPSREPASAPRGHTVQFYEGSAFLTEQVTNHIATGLALGGSGVVIATDGHRSTVGDALLRRGFMVDELIASGRLTLLDAPATLESLSIGGKPDRDRFMAVIGPVLERAAASGNGGVATYGEMVATLWDRGQRDEAYRLEGLWDEIALTHAFVLVCGYPMSGFADRGDGPSFARVMEGHGEVVPAESYAQLEPSARLRVVAGLQQAAAALETEAAVRIRADQKLRLRESELADFLESAAVGVHQVDADGVIVWANKAELQMLGYTADEYIGHSITEFYVDGSDAREILRRLTSGESLHDQSARLRAKDGSERHVLIHSNGYWEAGRFLYTRCFTRDVTDRVHLEQELRAKVAQLHDLDRRKDEFLAMLGHELRNPLAPVTTALQLALLHEDDPSRVRRSLELVDRQIRQMTRLIDDLLDVSRITRGTVELREENVYLSSIVQSAVETARPLVDERGHRLTVDLPPTPTLLFVDPARLQQILSNLLNNAAKYTDMGGHIHVSTRVDGDVTISVKDNGAGLTPELREHIFDLFVQGPDSPARGRGGLGIGLTLVRRLAELHGGSVSARSDGAGKGSEFVVTLPASVRRTAAATTAPATSSVDHAAALRVLVVDDNVDAAESLAELLRDLGHSVRVAHDGPSAIDLALRLRPQLVLLDIGLPEMDGYEVARRLRSQGVQSTLVALTGYGEARHRRLALDAGFDDHVTKPVDLHRLESLLKPLPLN
jgi:PAS domain S-box-containing protein